MNTTPSGTYRLKKYSNNFYLLNYYDHHSRFAAGTIKFCELTDRWFYSLGKIVNETNTSAPTKFKAKALLIEQHQIADKKRKAEYAAHLENDKRTAQQHSNAVIKLFTQYMQSTNYPCVYGKENLEIAKTDSDFLISKLFLIHEIEKNQFVLTTVENKKLKHVTLDFAAMIDRVRNVI